MGAALQQIIDARIAEAGRVTAAEYMELALYHPALGYYASRAQRSGKAGDFYTSVDVGPLFGACLAQFLNAQFVGRSPDHEITRSPHPFDLVEAGAGNGRLSRDILDAAAREYPEFYASIRLHLVERSTAARAAQRETLGPHAGLLASSGDTLPPSIAGAILANELLDAMPVHLVRMTDAGVRELYVVRDEGRYRLAPGPLSSASIAEQLAACDAQLEPGWQAEVSLAAAAWIETAARALTRGTLLVLDYGHEAPVLYSASHAEGTIVRYCGHRMDDRWLESPGDCDLTAHVNFTQVRRCAEHAGLRVRSFTDQTRFLIDHGIADRLPAGGSAAEVRQRLRARTLIAPEGLGGTIKVMTLERAGGTP